MIFEMLGMDSSHLDKKISVKEERGKIGPWDRNDGSKTGKNRKHNDGKRGVQKDKNQII